MHTSMDVVISMLDFNFLEFLDKEGEYLTIERPRIIEIQKHIFYTSY